MRSRLKPTSLHESRGDSIIVVRGRDLCKDLIGRVTFTEYFYLLLTGKAPSEAATRIVDATLVAIAEHGLVPSVQASRMTFAAAPDALQGAVAAGILGCGSVILGASETAGRMFCEIHELVKQGQSMRSACEAIVRSYRTQKRAIPGYGHPLHKERDPRVQALFDTALDAGADRTYIDIADMVEKVIPAMVGKSLSLNVSAAIPAVLLGVGFPLSSLRGVPILARTGGLIAHLCEEAEKSIGFALSYQASKGVEYEGEVPIDFEPSPGA